jgi:hypothetical protein
VGSARSTSAFKTPESRDNFTEQRRFLLCRVLLRDYKLRHVMPPTNPIDQLKREAEDQYRQMLERIAKLEKEKEEHPLPISISDLSPEDAIRRVLLEESLSTKHLSKAAKIPLIKLEPLIKKLKTDGKIFNMGFDDNPLWCWRVGDAEPAVLRAMIKRLISERPMSLADLVKATGASNSRVSGQLVELQSEHNIVDLSQNRKVSKLVHRKIYFLIGENIQSARLPTRTERRHLQRAAGAQGENSNAENKENHASGTAKPPSTLSPGKKRSSRR